jgi:hypothetical protein
MARTTIIAKCCVAFSIKNLGHAPRLLIANLAFMS